MANAGVLAATGDVAQDTWRRPVDYMPQAFSTGNTEPLSPRLQFGGSSPPQAIE
jgi:hypothetical protein